jgi:glycosyltransferase involved in cell wall biosynthesis
MAEADLFILTSHFEGLPNVVLESIACNTPVLAFNCPGGTNEIIIEGVNGWYAECGDIYNLRDKILHISGLGKSVLKGKISDSIIGKFDSDSVMNSYEKVLEEVIYKE